MSDITNVMKTIAADIDEKAESNAGQAAIVVEAKGDIVRVRFSGEVEAGETWFTSTINPVPIGCVGIVAPIRGNAGYFQPVGLNIAQGGGNVDSVNGKIGTVVLDADDINDASTSHKFVTASDLTKLSNLSGVNTGDQDLSGLATKAELASKADDSTLLSALPAAIGSNGQVLKVQSGGVSWQPDLNTTYTEISEAEITAGTASTLRTMSGRRAQSIVNKARDGVALASSLGSLAAKDKAAIADIDATGFASDQNFLRGDGIWAAPPNTLYAEIPEAEITAGTSSVLRAISGRRAQSIVNKARDGLALASSIPTQLAQLDTTVTGTQLNAIKTKVDGVATGATKNATDAQLRARSSHTGTQLAATISDFSATVASHSAVAANTSARHTHSNKSVLDSVTAAYTTAMNTKLSGIATGATKNQTDAYLVNRGNHTGNQAIHTITNLQEILDGKPLVVDPGNRSTAIGVDAQAIGNSSFAAGDTAIAHGTRSIAIGVDSDATGLDSTAIGQNADATNTRATAVGRDSHASGLNSSAYGWGADASGDNSIAIGVSANAAEHNTTALGQMASAASSGTAVGQSATASGTQSVALGGDATATGNSSIAVGYIAKAIGMASAAIGDTSRAEGEYSQAIGAFSYTSPSDTRVTEIGATTLRLRPRVYNGPDPGTPINVPTFLELSDAAGNPHVIPATVGQIHSNSANSSPAAESLTGVGAYATAKVIATTTLQAFIPAITAGLWDVDIEAHALVYRSVATGGVYFFTGDGSTQTEVALGRFAPQTNAYTLNVNASRKGLSSSSTIDLRYTGFGTAGTTYVINHGWKITARRVG